MRASGWQRRSTVDMTSRIRNVFDGYVALWRTMLCAFNIRVSVRPDIAELAELEAAVTAPTCASSLWSKTADRLWPGSAEERVSAEGEHPEQRHPHLR